MKKGPSKVVICIATANIMHPIDSNSKRSRNYRAFFSTRPKRLSVLKVTQSFFGMQPKIS